MTLLNLSRVALDPRFAQSFTVNRNSGTWQQGGFVETATPIPFYGIIQPATEEDLAQVPEANRVRGSLGVISEQRLFSTYVENGAAGTGDTFMHNNQLYKVVGAWPWGDFGFWKAVASRQSGE